jgi:hypothetical protein
VLDYGAAVPSPGFDVSMCPLRHQHLHHVRVDVNRRPDRGLSERRARLHANSHNRAHLPLLNDILLYAAVARISDRNANSRCV